MEKSENALVKVQLHDGLPPASCNWVKAPRPPKPEGPSENVARRKSAQPSCPEIALPVERAEIGNHVGCSKERILFYTAEPVPPHSPLPAEHMLSDGYVAWVWAELDHDMASLCDLQTLLADPDDAKQAELEGQLARAPQTDSTHTHPSPEPR